MAVDAETVQRLIDQLAKDRQAFVESTNRTHELLQQTLLALKSVSNQPQQPIFPPQYSLQQQQQQQQSTQPSTPRQNFPPPLRIAIPNLQPRRESVITSAFPTKASQRTTTADIEVESVPPDRTSSFTGDSDSESDDNDSIFVQTALQPEEYDMEGFRNHIMDYEWRAGGKAILQGLEDDTFALGRKCIFPTTQVEAEADRSHLSHYSIYDVGFDGVPLDVRPTGERPPTRSMEIWNRIRATNANAENRPAAGRIVIVREPSPKLFAALHYTMSKHFDVDEMFELLNDDDPGLMFPHRAFDKDTRKRRSFVITMEYFTIIGDMCKPMNWQRCDEEEEEDYEAENHIPITRCSSIIALSLEGPPMNKVKNRDRRIKVKYGDVYDPFSPWRVLSIQAYPDWHATTDTHKPTAHYVNGPEAFLHTIQAEFRDARKRLKEVYNRVGELVEPPPNFIFNSKVREALLFEDDKFTYSKKYFWAYQTLSIINQDITEMIESFRDTFRESVWEGSNKIIWPGESHVSSRYQQWRKRMSKLRDSMNDEVDKLEYIKTLNSKKMQDIEALRENLFSGTSVMESRRSVEQTLVTIEQNRSVLLLTLVTIFFLPLTFVTSVFGMTNMNPAESYGHFAWTVLAICIPTYMLIGSLHTDAGLNFWRRNIRALFARLKEWLAQFLALCGYVPRWAQLPESTRLSIAVAQMDPLKRASSATRLAMRIRPTADEHSPSISRVDNRDRYIPRPQPTSGDARFSRDDPVRTRSKEVTFAVENSVRMHNSVPQGDDESVSPRTGSPSRAEAWEAEKARVAGDTSEQHWIRGFIGRFGRKKEQEGREKPPNRQPSV